MKLFIIAVLTSGVAGAQSISCPRSFPDQDTPIQSLPGGRMGVGRLQPARLSNASIQVGDLFGEQGLQPQITKVRNGLNLKYGLPGREKWLVCVYGGSDQMIGNVDWWEKLAPRVSECMLQLRWRQDVAGAKTWTATANCT